MVSIYVFAKDVVTLESHDYVISKREDMTKFLEALLDKVAFSGERFCLEEADIVETKYTSPEVRFTEIKRWGF